MIKSVHKAMIILKVLSDNEPNSTKLMDVSNSTGIEKPTCSHILETLCNDGYVRRISHSKGYKLGPATFCLTRYGKYENSLITVCHPVLQWLSKKTSGISMLTIIESSDKYVIDYIDEDNLIFRNNGNIFTDDIYRTATGRIIMSHMDEEKLAELYKKHGKPLKDWDNIQSFDELKLKLKEIKSRDPIFTCTQKGDTYDTGFGKAIFRKRKCVGAIGIAHNSVHCEIGYFKNDIIYLESAAKEINRRLNYETNIK